MISNTNHDSQWGRSEVVIIYPDDIYIYTVYIWAMWITYRCYVDHLWALEKKRTLRCLKHWPNPEPEKPLVHVTFNAGNPIVCIGLHNRMCRIYMGYMGYIGYIYMGYPISHCNLIVFVKLRFFSLFFSQHLRCLNPIFLVTSKSHFSWIAPLMERCHHQHLASDDESVTWWLAAHINIYKQHINRFDIHNTITLTTPHDSPKMGPPKQMYPPLKPTFLRVSGSKLPKLRQNEMD